MSRDLSSVSVIKEGQVRMNFRGGNPEDLTFQGFSATHHLSSRKQITEPLFGCWKMNDHLALKPLKI